MQTIAFQEGAFGRVSVLRAAGPARLEADGDLLILVPHEGAAPWLALAGGRHRLDRDTVVHTGSGTPIGIEPDGEVRLLSVAAPQEWLHRLFPAIFDARPTAIAARAERLSGRERRLADALAIELLNDRFLSAGRLDFLVEELVTGLIESGSLRRSDGARRWRGSRLEDSRIRRALAILQRRHGKDVDIDEVASQVGLSRSRFYDLFVEAIGRSPRSYMDLLCVEEAIGRLARECTPIGEVSAGLGFSAQSNFTRFFLSQVGVPPSRYRRAATGRAGAAPASGDGAEPEG